MDTQYAVAILSGGQSRRFGGRDKQTLPFHGIALGRRAALNVLGIGLPVMIIGPQLHIYKGLDLEFAQDVMPGYGPLSGLHAALSKTSASWLYLLACDMPYFHQGWFSYLKEQAGEKTPGGLEPPLAILAEKSGYLEPFHGLYSRNILPDLEKKMEKKAGEGKKLSFFGLLEDLLHRCIPEYVARRFSPDWELFTSINDPDTLESKQKPGQNNPSRNGLY